MASPQLAPVLAAQLALPELSAFDRLQFHLLNLIASGEDPLSGSRYANESKIRVLLGDTITTALTRASTIIDFGCGYGEDSIHLAQLGCSHVIGLDIRQEVLAAASSAARAAGVENRCVFTKDAPPAIADAIISVDTFEHFDDPLAILQVMHGLVKPGGKVYITFGPTWYHPLGGHLFSVFPWAHLLFSESALCAWRAQYHKDGAQKFNEVAGGLNQMTIQNFLTLVDASPLRVEAFECVPIRRIQGLHSRLTREWTTATVRATLTRD